MAHPDFRLTLRPDGHIRVVDWGPWLATDGPSTTLLHDRERHGMLIADLEILRDDDGTALELIVHLRAGYLPRHRDTLCQWARVVGYRRVWVDDEVVDLLPAPGGEARTTCTGCRVELVDGSASFWDYVRCAGAFPAVCAICGSDLPQWSVASETVRSWPQRTTTTR